MLFSTLNLSFFLLLAVLLFLSIAAYYVHRLKEIGVLKLNGWTEWRITVHLIAPLLVQIYISMPMVMLPVVGYILYKDAAMIRVFLPLSLWMYLFLTLVILIAALGGVLFVRRVDRVGAIKNSRNNEVLLRILLLFTAAVTIMLILSMDITLTNVNLWFVVHSLSTLIVTGDCPYSDQEIGHILTGFSISICKSIKEIPGIGFAAQDAAAKQERRYSHIRCWRIFRYSARSANTPA